LGWVGFGVGTAPRLYPQDLPPNLTIALQAAEGAMLTMPERVPGAKMQRPVVLDAKEDTGLAPSL